MKSMHSPCDIKLMLTKVIFLMLNLDIWLELISLFDSFLLSPGKLLLTGDLNFHLDILSDPAAKQFSTLLDSFNLEQHVKVATHVKGHTLDPVITRCGELPVPNITVDHSVKNDHFAILFTLPLTAPTKAKVTVSMRKLKAIDIQAFSDSISASKLQQHVRVADNATEAYDFYNTTLREILDDHAPVTQRTITARSESPWFTTNIKLAKAKRRSLEKQWRRTSLTVHRDIYVQQCDLTNSLIQEAKKDYYHHKLSGPNQKNLYTVANELLHRKKQKVFPSQFSKDKLPDKFASFFNNKIQKLHSSLTGTGHQSTQQLEQNDLHPANLSTLLPANEEEIKKLLRSAKPKTCDLDPIPSHLLRQCETLVIPTLTDIVNKSLTCGMPSKMKQAIVTALLKKPTLNSDELKNYRPVSNLSFVSKLTEKVVAARLIAHLKRNNLQEPLQSAYRQYCSIETALLKVQNDILHILDKRSGAAHSNTMSALQESV